MLRNKPLIEQRPQAPLFLQWQVEETRGNRATATSSSASALPRCAAVTVEEVVVGDFIATGNRSKCDGVSRVCARDNVRVRIATRVDVALRHGHQHDATSRQVVLMPIEFTAVRPKRMCLVDDGRVIDDEHSLPSFERTRAEDAKPRDRRGPSQRRRPFVIPGRIVGHYESGATGASRASNRRRVLRTPSARRTGNGVTRGWP
jgi:hypothetical protein